MDTVVSTHPVSTHPRELVEADLHLSPVCKQKSNSQWYVAQFLWSYCMVLEIQSWIDSCFN